MSITMYDDVTLSQIPANPQAVAAYIDGIYANSAEAAARFPHAHLLTIAVSADADADCLDIEQGDASPAQAAIWYSRQRQRGIARPCIYASVSTMQADVLEVMRALGIPRDSVRLWSAHYDGKHICGPSSCGAVSMDMDGTQWTETALGRVLDESLLVADFFGSTPSPGWQEAMMQSLPTLQQGSKDSSGPLYVHRVQLLVSGIGSWNKLGAVTQVKADGNFGAATAAGVKRVQGFFGLTQDGVVGPDTWTALVTGSA